MCETCLTCPECGQEIWDGPFGSKLAKCWNTEGHADGGTLAFDTMDDGDDDETYSIVRFHFQGDDEIIDTGLTLDEAQAHCRREDTHGDGWFDGYTEE
jgi:hypothetical protein